MFEQWSPVYKRDNLIGKPISADFVCPWCEGRSKIPNSLEKMREYAAAGMLEVNQEVTQVATQYIPASQLGAKAALLWVASIWGTALWTQLTEASPMLFWAVVGIGGAAVGLIANQTRTVIEPVEEPEAPSEPMRVEATVNRSKFGENLVWYSAPNYEKSGRPVPDLKVWIIFDAYLHRTPFSVTGMSPIAGRPAFEAVCHDFIKRGLACMDAKGQDVQVKAAGKAVMREWTKRDRPPMIFERGEAMIERSK